MSHSKRNTSRPVFTSHERALAKSNWTCSSARLNRDSFLPFGSCSLCLEIARDPVACQHGDVFCRECALSNLLAQKKELKRAEKNRHDAEQEFARISAVQSEEEQARAVRDFEMTQAGLSATSTERNQQPAILSRDDPETQQDAGQQLVLAGNCARTKRKLVVDGDDLEDTAQGDRAKARKALDGEKAAKPSLPSFWTPSLTPQVQDAQLLAASKKNKTTPICPASTDKNSHVLSMQKLITIHFDEYEDSSTKDKHRTCPSCRKALSNASSAIMAKRCGHVMCLKCAKQFLIPSAKQNVSETDSIIKCYVCEEPVAVKPAKGEHIQGSLPQGLVSLKSEGTGFSARGTSTVEKSTVGFQC